MQILRIYKVSKNLRTNFCKFAHKFLQILTTGLKTSKNSNFLVLSVSCIDICKKHLFIEKSQQTVFILWVLARNM